VTKLQRQQNGRLTVPLKQPGTQIEDGDPSPRTNSQTLVFDMTAADSDDDDIPPDLTSNSSYEDWRANLDDCFVNVMGMLLLITMFFLALLNQCST
jgi:hypothetical protein